MFSEAPKSDHISALECRPDRYDELHHVIKEMEVREVQQFAESHSASRSGSQNWNSEPVSSSTRLSQGVLAEHSEG